MTQKNVGPKHLFGPFYICGEWKQCHQKEKYTSSIIYKCRVKTITTYD